MSTRHRLLEEYQELNDAEHETFTGTPTPLEFMRMIHISRPVLFENCPLPLQTVWTDQYLAATVGEVSVAVTPDGRADALVDHDDGRTYFVEPHTEMMSMKQLLDALDPGGYLTITSTSSMTDELEAKEPSQSEVLYLQSQNDNLGLGTDNAAGEFDDIKSDVPRDISWATEALGRGPDAVNIWIGNDRSVTSVHSDPYENIYAVIRGTKVFTLFPPTEGSFLEEREYPHACWTRGGDGKLTLKPNSGQSVRWSSIRDPTLPLPPTRPITVVVREGQTLYLPAGWWHHVQQIGKVVALNYWYDQEMQGHNYVFRSFLRSLGTPKEGNKAN